MVARIGYKFYFVLILPPVKLSENQTYLTRRTNLKTKSELKYDGTLNIFHWLPS